MTTINQQSKERFNEALQNALNLPTHNEQGELNPIYQTISETTHSHVVVYEGDQVERIFRAHPFCTRGKISDREGYYYADSKGAILYHKKYARTDKAVKEISFDVVGYKRVSSKLPAGVLVSNLQFVF